MNAPLMIDQRSDEWFKARLGRATASRFADCLATIKTGEAATRRNYRIQVVTERLTGQKQESFTNAAMEWGTMTEPQARSAYEFHTDNEVQEVGFFPHPDLMAGASPDGLIGDDGLLEIKCPNSTTHVEYLDAGVLPSKYVPQVQGQLWITGRKWADFVSFDPRMPHNLQLFVCRVERDDQYIAELEAGIIKFLAECYELETQLRAR